MKLTRGAKVVCKDDPDKKVGRVLSPPPAIIGDPQNPKGVFPISLPGLVYVEFGGVVCIERTKNLQKAPR